MNFVRAVSQSREVQKDAWLGLMRAENRRSIERVKVEIERLKMLLLFQAMRRTRTEQSKQSQTTGEHRAIDFLTFGHGPVRPQTPGVGRVSDHGSLSDPRDRN